MAQALNLLSILISSWKWMAEALNLIKDISISYIAQLALDKLFSLLGDGVELEKIKSSLNTIRSVIGSAEGCPLKDQALVDWLERLKDAAYDAEDVLDEYATEDQRRKVEAQNNNSVGDPLMNKVRKISLSILPVKNRAKMTIKLKEIRRRLESIEEERHKFELISERVQQWEREFKEYRETHSLVCESKVFGRKEDKVKMVNLLLAVAGHEDENVSVIPIVGMGGLGKTTLAQVVFNDEQVQNHFELKMWVCVSDDFDVRWLVKKIIDRANGHSSHDQSDLEKLQQSLQKALNGRRFLLVLDDVWNEEPEKWNRLRVLLMCGGRGSRILVTTRSPMVASIMSRIELHQLEGLLEEDCWKLFATCAFRDHRETDHLKLIEIGKDIVRKCRGVPLAVITLGSLLSFKKEESEWEFVRDSEMWNLAAEDMHGILPALRLSYYHLNPYVRQCFAFCAVFPKDHLMDKEFLIQLWMANGCFPSRRGMELEDIGIEILNELLMRSLFQEVKECHGGDDDNILKIKVHDLVHDLAQSVMGNDCCVIEHDKSVNISKSVRHLSFHRINSHGTPPDFLYEAQSLRTLLIIPRNFEVPLDMAIFKSLRVLSFGRNFEQPVLTTLPLPTSLCESIHLRYLKLVNVKIETLPESISNLQNLQTLILHYCHYLQELPKGIRNLINLRCLDIDSCNKLSHMPANIGMLSCLQKLPLFVVGDSASVCSGIQELQRLNLRGKLMIKHLERVAIPSNAHQANLIGKPNLQSLQLVWDKSRDGVEEAVLKGLQPHENLKELKIIGYGGIHFPSWMTCLLSNIVKITLEGCHRCELLPPLGRLPLLKFLRIHRIARVENIGSEFYCNDMSEGFPSLETLEIGFMFSLKVWSRLHGERVFPRLVKLTIDDCPMLTTITCFTYLTALQTLSITNCHKLANLSDELRYLTCLQILKIRSCTDLKSLPEVIGYLSSLKEFELSGGGLTSLPRGIGNLSSLQVLKLHQLHNFASLPESMQGLSTLRELHIWNCPQLGSLTSLPESMQEILTLRQLYISSCPRLPSLPMGIGNLSSLQVLELLELDSLTSLPESMQELSTLRELHICRCPQLPSLPRGIGNLSSLQLLTISQLESLTSLPESMQELSTLKALLIRSCPQLPSLPEWVENLAALQLLVIDNCPQMVSLPVGLQRLIGLQSLRITHCPELQRRCGEKGQDAHKIKHILEVELDDQAQTKYHLGFKILQFF